MKSKLVTIATLILLAALILPGVKAIGSEGLFKEINVGNTVLFQIQSDTANAKLTRVDTDIAGNKFAVLSIGTRYWETRLTPVFYPGDTLQFDTNANGYNDLEITLDSIQYSRSASFAFKELAEPAKVVEPVTQLLPRTEEKAMVKEQPVTTTKKAVETQPARTGVEPVTGQAVKESSNNTGRTITWVVLGAIVLIAIVIYATRKKQQ